MLSRRFFQLMLLSLLVPMVALADAVLLYDKAIVSITYSSMTRLIDWPLRRSHSVMTPLMWLIAPACWR